MPDLAGVSVASTGAVLVRGSILRVLAMAAGMAVSLFLMPFLIRALGDHWYGIWTLVVTITAYYTLLDFGMARAATRFLARAITLDDLAEASSVVTTALAILVAVSGIGIVAAIAMAFGAAWWISDPLEIEAFRYALLILAVDAAVGLPALVINAVLVAHYRFDILSCVQVAGLLVRTALMVWVVLEGHSIVALALVVLGINMLSRAVLAAMVRYLFPRIELKPARFRRAQARQLFRYGKHAFLASCADRARSTAGILVVGFFVDMVAVTHYSIAARIAQLFAELMLQCLGVVGPLFMRSDALGRQAKTREILLLTTRLSVLASVTMAGAVILLGPPFIEFWIGEDYRDVYLPLTILTMSFAVWMMQWPSISVSYATAKHQFYAYLSLGEAVASVALSALLVQFAGLIGVSLGTALPLLFSMLVLQPRHICRIIELECGTYYREIGRTAFLVILYQVPLFVCVYGLQLSSLLLIFAIAAIYYPACLLFLLRQTLARSERYQLGRAIPALQWLAW